jgi:outer membrane protein OmpA-like peptidoglycan-associated protein
MKIGILFFLSAVILFSEGFLNATAAQNNRIPAGWEKYDFIPGYQLIFYDDFSNDRLNEKPQAWKLIEGNTEVILFDNLRWLRAINQSFVAPQLEILPAQFTLEMDFYVTPRGYSGNYRVDIYGQTDNDWAALTIEDLGAYFNTSWGLNLEYPLELQGRHRLSIALTNDGFKCYVDSLRVISTPKSASFRPRDFEIFMPGGEKAGDDKSAITNVRVAYLDKNFREQIQVNGKIVSYGMTFSNGAVNPKPEAFATLKELAALMQNDLNLNLSIECHVYELDDVSDNNRLSQQRAEALRETLITLYKVEGDRLRTKGWGSAKPLENDIVDSRAANPRVEFVKR